MKRGARLPYFRSARKYFEFRHLIGDQCRRQLTRTHQSTWSAQKIPLSTGAAEGAERRKLLLRLNAFGHDSGPVGLQSECEQRSPERLAGRVLVDAASEVSVKLDDV